MCSNYTNEDAAAILAAHKFGVEWLSKKAPLAILSFEYLSEAQLVYHSLCATRETVVARLVALDKDDVCIRQLAYANKPTSEDVVMAITVYSIASQGLCQVVTQSEVDHIQAGLEIVQSDLLGFVGTEFEPELCTLARRLSKVSDNILTAIIKE